MLKLVIFCLAGVIIVPMVLALLSVPVSFTLAMLPWLLRVAGVVLTVKALLDKPIRWENFTPALGAFLLSAVIKWVL